MFEDLANVRRICDKKISYILIYAKYFYLLINNVFSGRLKIESIHHIGLKFTSGRVEKYFSRCSIYQSTP